MKVVGSVVKDVAWRRDSAHTTRRRRTVGTIVRTLRRGGHPGGAQVKGSTTFFGEVDDGNLGSEHPSGEAHLASGCVVLKRRASRHSRGHVNLGGRWSTPWRGSLKGHLRVRRGYAGSGRWHSGRRDPRGRRRGYPRRHGETLLLKASSRHGRAIHDHTVHHHGAT